MHPTLKAVAASLILATSSVASASAEEITLDVWATPSIFKSMFDRLVDGFEAKNPDIKINLDASQRSQEDIVQAVLRQALVGDLPDISFQGPNFLRTIADLGVTVPLDGLIAGDPDWTSENYSEALAAGGTVSGSVHGIPIGLSVPVLFYNADLVKQAQGDAPFPDTWDGIIGLAAKIGSLNSSVVGGFYRTDALFYQAQVNARGGTFMNEAETEIAFTGPEGLDALTFYKRIGEAGQGRTPMTRDQARQAFAGGTVGMLSDTSSGIASRLEEIGDRFTMGVASFPIPAADGGIPSPGIVATISTKDEARQQAAWLFIKYLVSVEGQEIVATETSYIPANGAVFDKSDVLKNLAVNQPLLAPALDSANHAVAWYAFPGQNAAKIDEVMAATIEAVSTLRIKPEEALSKMRSDVEALLPR
ncbi:extracellular solute-binding protein [Pseudochelatococcus sp. B33]